MNSVLECRNVHKVFTDAGRELHVLRGVNVAVKPREILAISGASGAGKSTLLHIMGTLDRPTEGEVIYGDTPVQAMGRRAVNRLRNEDIGFVFQFYHLLPEFTALENAMMPALAAGKSRESCRERAEELLIKVGLAERMGHKPGQLSGGEQQRVAIARALFNRPRVVLSDEPTGNLDEHTGMEITDLLWELNLTEDMTLVVVTHNMGIAKRAHRWIHLHDGVAQDRM